MSEKSLPTLASELWDMVRAYAKQETIEPFKGILRFVGYGVAGGVSLSVGLVLLSLAGLRALQTETGSTFEGNWSWAPYAIVAVVAVLLVALLASRMAKRKAH